MTALTCPTCQSRCGVIYEFRWCASCWPTQVLWPYSYWISS